MQNDYEKFAIHWVPRDGTALADFGASWTGWCAEGGVLNRGPAKDTCSALRPGVPGSIAKIGLHAAVKSPFTLASGRCVWTLEQRLEMFAEHTSAIRLPRFELTVFDGQVVLALSRPCRAMTRMIGQIADLVRPLQASPSYAGAKGLAALASGTRALPSDRDWGATRMPPIERFHLPLTDRLALGEAFEVISVLRPLLAPILDAPQRLADLALVAHPGGNGPWHVLERHELRDCPVRAVPRDTEALRCKGPRLMRPLKAHFGIPSMAVFA